LAQKGEEDAGAWVCAKRWSGEAKERGEKLNRRKRRLGVLLFLGQGSKKKARATAATLALRKRKKKRGLIHAQSRTSPVSTIENGKKKNGEKRQLRALRVETVAGTSVRFICMVTGGAQNL